MHHKTHKIQVKYRSNGYVPTKSSWSDANGVHTKKIDTSLIDCFAMVCDEKVCFVPSSAAGKTIRFELPNSATPYYWWEDCVFGTTELPPKRKRIGFKLPRKTSREIFSTRKVERPTKEELGILLQTKNVCAIGREFGVSDNAIRKWRKAYGL